jgi:2-amino-4-hydroxy-6-hydroxymethyldihydropteridine diphosphokinase
MPSRVHIGIGSNLGDRLGNTREAVDQVSKLPGTHVVRASSLYESQPHGDAEPWFVNSVIEIATDLSLDVLLDRLFTIEQQMGRTRTPGTRWASRIIDLDILLSDEAVVDEPGLQVPHPEMHKRRFVLMPLAEIAPTAIHPHLGQTISALLAEVDDPKRVTLLARDA